MQQTLAETITYAEIGLSMGSSSETKITQTMITDDRVQYAQLNHNLMCSRSEHNNAVSEHTNAISTQLLENFNDYSTGKLNRNYIPITIIL